MAERFKGFVKLSQNQYEELKNNGTLVVNGITYTYSPLDTIYVTPDTTETQLAELSAKIDTKLDAKLKGTEIVDEASLLDIRSTSEGTVMISSSDVDGSTGSVSTQPTEVDIALTHVDKSNAVEHTTIQNVSLRERGVDISSYTSDTGNTTTLSVTPEGATVNDIELLTMQNLPKFTNRIYVNMGNDPDAFGTINLPIVDSSYFFVDWGDNSSNEYFENVTELTHSYSDVNFAGWITIYGDFKGIQYGDTDVNHDVVIEVDYDLNITRIETYSFKNCTKLSRIKLPDSLVYIGGYAFQNCLELKIIRFPGSLTTLGNYSFSNTGLIDLILNTNVNILPNYCFQGCSNLKSIILGPSISKISSDCFAQCYALAKINFSEGLTDIQQGALQGSNKTSTYDLVIPSSVTHLGMGCLGDSGGVDPDRVIFRGISVPSFDAGPTGPFVTSKRTILVPYSSLRSYKSNSAWSRFGYIDRTYPIGGTYSEVVTITSDMWTLDSASQKYLATPEVVGSTTEERNELSWYCININNVQTENVHKISAITQGSMSMTFSCDTQPPEDIRVRVVSTLTNY